MIKLSVFTRTCLSSCKTCYSNMFYHSIETRCYFVWLYLHITFYNRYCCTRFGLLDWKLVNLKYNRNKSKSVSHLTNLLFLVWNVWYLVIVCYCNNITNCKTGKWSQCVFQTVNQLLRINIKVTHKNNVFMSQEYETKPWKMGQIWMHSINAPIWLILVKGRTGVRNASINIVWLSMLNQIKVSIATSIWRNIDVPTWFYKRWININQSMLFLRFDVVFVSNTSCKWHRLNLHFQPFLDG